MDVTAWLLRHTPVRPLVLTVPGGTQARLAVQRIARVRGWRPAICPAEANLLVTAGTPAADIRPYLEQVWDLIPAPRARAHVHRAAVAADSLADAESTLRDIHRQRRTDHGGPGDEAPAHGEMPGDVPMADRAEDRDGLMLDQLHLPLGPALPEWPAGLIVHTAIQGDVIQHATVDLVGLAEAGGTPDPRWSAVRPLDSCAGMLALAGWRDAAATAYRLRDRLLARAGTDGGAAGLGSWARRVQRSQTLRWLLAGLGTVPDGPGTPAELAGDALARLDRWINLALRAPGRLGDRSAVIANAGRDTALDRARQARWILAVLPRVLEGTELGTARLTVASLDPDIEALAHHGVTHG